MLEKRNDMDKVDTKQKLLESAKQEFLTYGFQKASLRNICKNAGVTTGALYFFFADKATLFEALVKDVAEQLMDMLKAHTLQEETTYRKHPLMEPDFDIEFGKELISFYYENQDVGELLFRCAEGSSYQHFVDEIIAFLEQRNKVVLSYMVGRDNDVFNECTMHWLSHLQVEAFLHVLSHNFSKEQSIKQIEIVVTYLRGGFNSLYQKAQTNKD